MLMEKLGMQSYQALFSTLGQIVVTLLSLLFASISAYYVFLQDRTTQFSDKIEREKLEIGDSLIQFRAGWPWLLSTLVPPEFQDKYRSRYPNKSKIDFVTQIATDLLFSRQEMQDAISDVRENNSYVSSLHVRLYFCHLTNAFTTITI